MTEDILHETSGPDTRWSTVNMAEVLPGVLTPLGWTFWRDPAETGLRGAFCDAGVLAPSELPPPASIDRRLTGLFHGRYAGNLTFICELCDRTPGSSGESFEEQMFGYADPDVERSRSFRRYPVVAVKMPVGIALLGRRLRRIRRDTDAWWRTVTSSSPEPPEARLEEARGKLRDALRIHMFCSLVAQGCYDQVAGLAAAAGQPGLELELMTGYGGMEEVAVAEDLWSVSRGRLTLDEFVSRHGYHGPGEGELSNPSWRENRGPVESLLGGYAKMADGDNPAGREGERAQVRGDAERRLLAGLPRARGPAARLALRAAAKFLPLREVGKVAFLQAIDGGRCAAREIGAGLVAAGAITEEGDVFYLTIDELGRPPADARAILEQRRAQRAGHLEHQIPERWTGEPEAIVRAAGSADAAVSGVPVSPGVAEGRARVITDPGNSDDFEPGDILVCETTDPSWVVFFQLAAAVVIDVGGPLSHGAIVARELGIPAVINTRNGTTTIADGSHVRVDGATGNVEVLSAA